MDAFKVRVKTNNMLDRYMSLSYEYPSRIGYDALIQSVILKEVINIMSTTITDLDRELKIKTGRIEYLESKTNSLIFKRSW